MVAFAIRAFAFCTAAFWFTACKFSAASFTSAKFSILSESWTKKKECWAKRRKNTRSKSINQTIRDSESKPWEIEVNRESWIKENSKWSRLMTNSFQEQTLRTNSGSKEKLLREHHEWLSEIQEQEQNQRYQAQQSPLTQRALIPYYNMASAEAQRNEQSKWRKKWERVYHNYH